MRKAPLGRTAIEVPRLCLGGNVFGWTVGARDAFALLDHAAAAGLTFIDTANSYSAWVPGNKGGESESILGDWMAARGNRGNIVIATKVGHDLPDRKGRLTREHIRWGIEQSLRRLRTDYVDLYYSHYDDPTTPMGETLGTYAELIAEGKVRAIGASNFTAERLEAALELAAREELPRYEALQPNYNLYTRDQFEGPLAEVALREGLAVVPYFALARGFLTGKYRSVADLASSARGGGNAQFLNPRGFRILDALDAVAAETEASPAEVALAWLAAQPAVTAPIASATSVAQVDALARAAALDLDPGAIARLTAASA